MDKNDKILYIGSTINTLHMRALFHKATSKTKSHIIIYSYINENGGWSNYTFKVLEEYVCEKIENLREREKYYYELHKPELNSNRPYLTKEERITLKKENEKRRRAIKTNCECGGRYYLGRHNYHFKTIKHQTYIQAINI